VKESTASEDELYLINTMPCYRRGALRAPGDGLRLDIALSAAKRRILYRARLLLQLHSSDRVRAAHVRHKGGGCVCRVGGFCARSS
jgi:hypothetical protein